MIILISAVEVGLGAQAAGMTSAYSSVQGMQYKYPIFTLIALSILALLVRRAIRKNRIAKELHYKIGQRVMTIADLESVPIHSIGTIKRVHATEPITLDILFIDAEGKQNHATHVEEINITKNIQI